MTLKRPVTLAQARRWPAAAARRESFCARMGGMRDKLTSDRTARDPRSAINRALVAWDCDKPEGLQRKHVTKGIRPMKITQKMVGAEARRNPAINEPMYVHAHMGTGKVEFYKAMVPQFAPGGAKKAADQVAARLGFPVFVGSRQAGSTDDGYPVLRFEYVNEDASRAILLFVRSMPAEGARYKAVKAISKNPARKAAKVKANPVRYRNEAKETKKDDPAWIGYAVHRPTQPGTAYAILTTKAEAIEYAQELADRKKSPFSVTRIRYKVEQSNP